MEPDRSPSEEPASSGGQAGGARGSRGGRKAFLLRLPPELHDELRGWAAAELRSLNGHIEYLLREAVRRRRKADPGAD